MATKFTPAPDVQEIADRYIAEYHEHLIQNAVKMVYLFRDDVPVRLGKNVMGEAKKVTGLSAFLAGQPAEIDYEEISENPDAEPFFAIIISQPIWDRLTLPQREALIDHELSHCYAEENDEGEVMLKMQAHDLGEFNAVVRRHGLWQADVEQFLKAAQKFQGQLSFSDDEDMESSEDMGRVIEFNSVQEMTDKLKQVAHQARGRTKRDAVNIAHNAISKALDQRFNA
jgi:hypothetical protein